MSFTIASLPTKLFVSAGRMVLAFPQLQVRYLRLAKDYVDWRSEDIVCSTIFSSRLKCNLRDAIQRRIAYFGIWEPNLTAYIRRTLKPGDVFVDVGANIGYFSLLGSSVAGATGEVVAIEASPPIFTLLRENIERNNVSNVRIVNCAAAYEAGEVGIYAAPKENIGLTSTMPQGENVFIGAVQALPLQNILTEAEASRTRLIKIDVEGAEFPILKSIIENLHLYSRDCEIAAEVSPINEDVLAFMRVHGFNTYLIDNEYSDRAYIRRIERAPTRFDGTPTAQADFIFSREDRAYL